MRKIVTLVYALVVTLCWAQEPISDNARPSSYEAVIADIARQLLNK